MHVKTQFSIKDLENLSGVKAHTIRIWEKRYNLLEPTRTDTNIRKYDMVKLKKLLNVTFLYNEGFKISKIASFQESEILKIVNNQALTRKEDYAITAFKSAMFEFDQNLFTETYNQLLEEKSFREVFFEVFLPLLNEIGMLWQTGTIDPAHERFISELIKQKIVLRIEAQQRKAAHYSDFIFVLYLPYQEIHEIGLLYANYEILHHGYRTLYLGSNIPIESLTHVTKHHENIKFVTYFTVKPDNQTVPEYLDQFTKEICKTTSYPLYLMGSKVQELNAAQLPNNATVLGSLQELITALGTLNN